MIIITVELKAKPGMEKEVEDSLVAFLPHVSMKGIYMYYVHRAIDDPGSFMFYEQYESKEAADASEKSPSLEELKMKLDGKLSEVPVETHHELIGWINSFPGRTCSF